ncbi:MAG: FadR family transcriptional regulator [Blautia sp.]|nr:FadR family transcriptional regulator [Blautia sp.]
MKAIAKVSVVQLAEDEIRKYILSEKVSVGDKLPSEKEFCDEMNIGRGSVREALRLLQAKGLVDIVQGKGAFVASKEEKTEESLAGWFRDNEVELKDINEVRLAIEPMAIRLAVERGTEREFRKLESNIEAFRKAAQQKDSKELALLDEKFHSILIECTHNQLLIAINREIAKNLRPFRAKTFQIEANVDNCIPYHSAITQAIRDKDEKAARKKLLEHLEKVEADIETSKNINE